MDPLYDIVNYLYNSVMNYAPDFFKERPVFSAFSLGFLGSSSLVSSLQYASKNLVNKIIPEFDDKILPSLEKACIFCITSIPLAYSFFNPEDIENIISNHPVYTSGMLGVYLGSVYFALKDLNKRK